MKNYDGVVDVNYLPFANELPPEERDEMSDSMDMEDDDEFVEMYHDNNFSDESGDTLELIGETKENGNYAKPKNKGILKNKKYYGSSDFPIISERLEEYDEDGLSKDMNKRKVIDSRDHRMKTMGDKEAIIKDRKKADKKRRKEEEEEVKRREKENKKRKKKEKKDKKKEKKKNKKKKKKADSEDEEEEEEGSEEELSGSEYESEKKKKKKDKKKKKKKKKKKGESETEEESGEEDDEKDKKKKDKKDKKKKKKEIEDSEEEEEDEEDEKEKHKAARRREKLKAKKDEEKKYQIFEYDIQDTNMTFATKAKPTVLTKTNIGHSLWLSAITFIPEKSILVTGGYDDNRVKIWRLEPITFSLSKIAEYRGHVGHITMLLYVPDKQLLAVGSQDCSFSILSLKKIQKAGSDEDEKDVLVDEEEGSINEVENR